MVEKIPFVDNLADPFTKTLIRSHRNSIGVRCVLRILQRHDVLRVSRKMLRYDP